MVRNASRAGTLGTLAGLLGFGLFMGRYVNVNEFSLHAMYRNRLVRAYLAASQRERAPRSFTGFDPRDDLEMAKLAAQRPLHVLNLALDVVSARCSRST